MKTAKIRKLVGSGWLLEIFEGSTLVSESQHPSMSYARDAAKRHGARLPAY